MALDGNAVKLKALCEFFAIPVSSVAKTCGVSRAYLSRVLSPRDSLQGSGAFWLKVEANLPALVSKRQRQVFQIQHAPVEQVEQLRKAG